MISPTNSPIRPLRLEGSSRVTGGFSRGHALGNVFNFADAEDVAMDNTIGSAEGKVLLYFSNQNPADVNFEAKPSASFKHEVVSTVKPVLKAISGKFSPIKSKPV
ncbi:MAG: hypothetical protein WCD57_19430 [Acidobacteriaceae bacterium]